MDHNEFAVSPSQVTALIEACIRARRPAMIWGAPGVGKSDIIAQIGAKYERPVIDMRLLIMEPTDIKGIPFYCPDTNTMRWARPGELPGEDEIELHNAILFLDEITAAPPSVQAAAYQLVLNRRVGTYTLPAGVDIVAAGNRVTDRAVSHQMPSALKNRFVHFTVKTSVEDWIEWAIRNKIHSDIVGFIKAKPDALFNFDPKSPDYAFASPRTWAFVDSVYQPGRNETMNRQLVGGTVGQGLAVEFMAHVRLKERLPTPKEILDGKVQKLTADQKEIGPSALYSLIVGLCYELKARLDSLAAKGIDAGDDNDWKAAGDRFLDFMMENMGPEMTLMGAMVAFGSYALPLDDESDIYEKFFQRHRKYITP